jgi:hypothetical protein
MGKILPLNQRASNFVNNSLKKHVDKNNKPLYNYDEVKYIDAHYKVKIFCKKCLLYFYQSPNDHLSGGCGCQKCGSKKNFINITYTTEQFIKKARSIRGDKYDYSKVKYKNSHTFIIIICKKHGEFLQRPNGHISGKYDCPKCKISVGEAIIETWLKKHDISYKSQYKFDDCYRSKLSKMRFDFYLPNFNTCIEFDGIQHFGKGRYYEKSIFDRDNFKNDYCKQNNIRLIRIPHFEINNISNILDKELCLLTLEKE